MEVEGINDFRALRAKFQNDSNFSNTVPQPPKKPPAESLHLPSSDTKGVSSPRILNQGKVLMSEQKREQFCSAVHSSELMQSKPFILPRVKHGNLYLAGKNEGPKNKAVEGALCGDAPPRGDSQKPRPTSCISQQASVNANSEEELLNSFHHTLQIWESASAQNDRKSAVLPPPQCISGNPSAQPRVLNTTLGAESNKMRSAGKEQVLDFSTQKKSLPASRMPILPQTSSPPRPSSGYKSTEQSLKTTGFSQLAYDPHKPSETSQYLKASEPFLHHAGTERQLDVKDSKPPKVKPLPSVKSLGSPPKKPLRPPKLNLGAFRQSAPHVSRRNETAAVEDDYMAPENAESEELHNYEETISYVKQSGNSLTSCAIQDIADLSSTGIQEHEKKQKTFLFATSSTERVTEDEKKEKSKWDLDRERQQQAKKTSKISGSEDMLHKSQIHQGNEGGKNKLQVKQRDTTDVIQTGKWLAKDGVEHSRYVCVSALKADEDMVALSQRILKPMQTSEDVYDDVEDIECAVNQASDAFSSFTSDSFSENKCDEIYEDIHNGDYNPIKLDLDRIEKLKQFGKFFKKDIIKLKNAKMKENRRILSSSVPNLDVVSQGNVAYDDIDVDQKDAKEKDDKHKNWKLKFLMPKDKDQIRSSEDDIESLSSRNFFKAKKYNIDRRKKVAKEEKLFREKFMYNKEITIVNTAVAHCSVASKGKLDLPITAGEQLDVIDITEENQVICRNSEGKYGYVLLEHLDFRH
ncbi:FYN-binding protein 2 isoform X2 [Terrapene carolina triunguis]|uniref:FYN-binding protein 2 isoform X2 n=2 Tax=Terrapene triunguis TaxID=2587831 RepID=UPI000E774E3D|nr:FYN-binding protein 2 isoform X2 [Terrapene carolina triunguis]